MELQSFIKIVLILPIFLFFSCKRDDKEKSLLTNRNDSCSIYFFEGEKIKLYQNINDVREKIAIYKVLEVYPNPDSLFTTKTEHIESGNSNIVAQKNFIFKDSILYKVMVRVSYNDSNEKLKKYTNKKGFNFFNEYSDSLKKLNCGQKCFKRIVLDSSEFNKTIMFAWE